jgi:hypothetical protein
VQAMEQQVGLGQTCCGVNAFHSAILTQLTGFGHRLNAEHGLFQLCRVVSYIL